MDDKKIIGVIGTLAVLLSSGAYLLNDVDDSKLYLCTGTEEIGVFERISSTGVTAYPFKGNNTGQVRCSGGVWVLASPYLQDKESPKQEFNGQGKVYICSVDGCKEGLNS